MLNINAKAMKVVREIIDAHGRFFCNDEMLHSVSPFSVQNIQTL